VGDKGWISEVNYLLNWKGSKNNNQQKYMGLTGHLALIPPSVGILRQFALFLGVGEEPVDGGRG
jgi:hypothetical protein